MNLKSSLSTNLKPLQHPSIAINQAPCTRSSNLNLARNNKARSNIQNHNKYFITNTCITAADRIYSNVSFPSSQSSFSIEKNTNNSLRSRHGSRMLAGFVKPDQISANNTPTRNNHRTGLDLQTSNTSRKRHDSNSSQSRREKFTTSFFLKINYMTGELDSPPEAHNAHHRLHDFLHTNEMRIYISKLQQRRRLNYE